MDGIFNSEQKLLKPFGGITYDASCNVIYLADLSEKKVKKTKLFFNKELWSAMVSMISNMVFTINLLDYTISHIVASLHFLRRIVNPLLPFHTMDLFTIIYSKAFVNLEAFASKFIRAFFVVTKCVDLYVTGSNPPSYSIGSIFLFYHSLIP